MDGKMPAHGFDYVIGGTGSAGCVVANRLSAKAHVLLIEAGPFAVISTPDRHVTGPSFLAPRHCGEMLGLGAGRAALTVTPSLMR